MDRPDGSQTAKPEEIGRVKAAEKLVNAEREVILCGICDKALLITDATVRRVCGCTFHADCMSPLIQRTCPKCGARASVQCPTVVKALQQAAVNIAHQELVRVVDETEAFLGTSPDPEGWVDISALGMYLSEDLGYEDQDELEDGIGCELEPFLEGFPMFEVKNQKVRKIEQPHVAPKYMELKVTSPDDLWRLFLKAPGATVSVPELEFEIGATKHRVVDSIYNHLAEVVFRLENKVNNVHRGVEEMDPKDLKYMEEIYSQIAQLLDGQTQFTWRVEDPTGLSEMTPDHDCKSWAMTAEKAKEKVESPEEEHDGPMLEGGKAALATQFSS